MSPPDPLLKLAKIVRSQQHAQTLQEQQTTFYGSDDHGVVADFHSEPGYLIVKAFSWVSPPAEWSLIIGEALYQFRSTLDHLVCERTEANGQTVDSGVEFPIFDKPEKFRKPDGNLTWKADRNIGRLSFADQAIIESEQPFNGKYGISEDDPLLILHDLARYDRHRNLHLVATAIRDVRGEFNPVDFAKRYFTQVSASYGQPLEGEAEVARYRIDPAAYDVVPSVEMNVQAHVTFHVAFDQEGPGAGRPVVSTLGAIGARVALLLGRFY